MQGSVRGSLQLWNGTLVSQLLLEGLRDSKAWRPLLFTTFLLIYIVVVDWEPHVRSGLLTPHSHVLLLGQPLADGCCLYLQHDALGAGAFAGSSGAHALLCLSHPDMLSPRPGTLGVLPPHSRGL